MTFLPALLLALCLAAVAWFMRDDVREYERFKLLAESRARQARYRIWGSFLLFSGAAVIGLALLGRLEALFTLPAEFADVAARLRAAAPMEGDGAPSGDFLFGMIGAVVVGLAVGALPSLFKSREKAAQPVVLGDVEALLPRNVAEMAHTALLSLNAGLSEELFFRLFLPLLLVLTIGSAEAALVVAALIFGLVHYYQGWVGVAATTVMGAVLSAIYLWTGNIWIAVAAHAGLDLVSLVVRPAIAMVFARR